VRLPVLGVLRDARAGVPQPVHRDGDARARRNDEGGLGWSPWPQGASPSRTGEALGPERGPGKGEESP